MRERGQSPRRPCKNAGNHPGALQERTNIAGNHPGALQERTNMAFKETLAAAREQRGMTQQDLAEKLYVTRQAVSRWENGETEPSVDMRKLIATVLDVPVIQLFDIDVSQLCQCCGTPFTVPNMPHGTDADGAENDSYCKWCYDGGQFAYQSEDELIEKTAPFLMEATGMSQEEAVSFMGVLVPHLQHWQK